MQLKADMESFKCAFCQSVYFPEKNDDGVRVLDEPADEDCPLCKLPLTHAVLANLRIVYCSGCHGMLIPMQALEALVEQLRPTQGAGAAPVAPDTEDLHRAVNCPQCHHPMDAHFYAGGGNVVIDSCEDCSVIWLDRGKLMHIVQGTANAPASTSEWE
jgi:Zn-finger nucleic acid-binding protein